MKYRILSLVKCIVITAHFSVNVNIYFSQLCAAMGIRPASGRVHAPAVPFRGHRGGYSLALYPSRSPSWAQRRLLTGSVPFSLSFVGTNAATHWLCTLLALLRGHRCGYSLALYPSRSPSWAQMRLLTGSVPFSLSFVGTEAATHWLCTLLVLLRGHRCGSSLALCPRRLPYHKFFQKKCPDRISPDPDTFL